MFSAGFAAVAAGAAWWQVLLQGKHAKEQRVHDLNAHRAVYYRSNVYEPAIALISSYADQIEVILDRAHASAAAAVGGGGAPSPTSSWQRARDEQKALAHTTRNPILRN